MEHLIKEIMAKAIEITMNTETDIFIDYSGHVNTLYVFYYKNGWKSGIEEDFDMKINLNFKTSAEQSLKIILEELKKLEEGE